MEPEKIAPEVGEEWEHFKHYRGKVTKVEKGLVTWEPITWLGRSNTYSVSMFLYLFTKKDPPSADAQD